MIRIGLLSDTHSYLDEQIFGLFEACDEIWHAGDIGNAAVADALEAFRPLRAVYGNIDDKQMQLRYPENQIFVVDGLSVIMTHIAGSPNNYTARAKKLLLQHRPQLFICGHSHIAQVQREPILGGMHFNPGACGLEGWHKMKTALRFSIHEGRISQLELLELGKRGTLSPEELQD
jgi:uncharacterized protein